MSQLFRLAAFALLPLLAAPASAAPAGDAAKGKTIFLRCAMCHSVQNGMNKIGPSLAGVVGRKAGAIPGYGYSPVMKASKVTWTPRALDTFLARPSIAMPGTKMVFIGLPNPADRASVIAYLQAAK
jgi:cytochrome c